MSESSKSTSDHELEGLHSASTKATSRIRLISGEETLSPLQTLTTARDFAQVFVDITAAHKCLYDIPRILHGDINMSNIMYRTGLDGIQVHGVLTDFDGTTLQNSPLGVATTSHRSGTLPFIAVDILTGIEDRHLYHHDLESIFHVMLAVSSLYELWPLQRSSSISKPHFPRHLFLKSTQKEDYPFPTWFRYKRSFFERHIHSKQTITYRMADMKLTASFECLRPWLIMIQCIFAGGLTVRLSYRHMSGHGNYERRDIDNEERPHRTAYRSRIPVYRPIMSAQYTLDEAVCHGHVTFDDFLERAFCPGSLNLRYPDFV